MSGDLGHDAEAQAEAEAGVAAAAEAEAEAGSEADADAIAIVMVVPCCSSSFKDRGPSPVLHSTRPAPRPASSSMCDCTGFFKDDRSGQPILHRCKACQDYPQGDRCTMNIGKEAGNRNYRFDAKCKFC